MIMSILVGRNQADIFVDNYFNSKESHGLQENNMFKNNEDNSFLSFQ